MDTILKKALETIKPTTDLQKKLKIEVDAFMKRLSPIIDAEVTVGGSYAKNSYLSDVKDIDIYVRFDKNKYADKDISEEIHKALKKLYNDITILHGSRDYFQVQNGFMFEIVPIIAIDDAKEALNITDISPLHVKWVNNNCKNADQMRLMKAFAKAQGFYGAESYIMGFSGYALEILVSIYGGFENTLKEVVKWKKKVIIDPENKHKDVMFEVNSSKTNSPVVLIDPVEKGRNTTASLSDEKLDLFVRKAKQFLAEPNESFFEAEKFSIDKLKEKAGKDKLIVIDIKNNEGKEDVEGCKILKVHSHIYHELVENGFKVNNDGWNWNKIDKATLWFIIDPEPLSKTYIRRGPPVKVLDNAESFKNKYPQSYEEKERLYAEVDRNFTDPLKLIEYILDSEYIKERIKSSSVIHL